MRPRLPNLNPRAYDSADDYWSAIYRFNEQCEEQLQAGDDDWSEREREEPEEC
jgi:hypothetical protein